MDTCAVTVKDYAMCVTKGSCTEPEVWPAATDLGFFNWGMAERQNHPINGVTWEQANGYCLWQGKRLPTAEEWNVAAGIELGLVYPWGDEPATCQRANMTEHDDSFGCGKNHTSAVGSFPLGASPWGILDLAGNVGEWTSTEQKVVLERYNGFVIKGGNFGSTEKLLQITSNYIALEEELTDFFIGFRCAKSADDLDVH
jgi:eukaryotic-like serine/threonine-protein kinase